MKVQTRLVRGSPRRTGHLLTFCGEWIREPLRSWPWQVPPALKVFS